jgi:CDP-glucose 4,6-dehydratase
MINNCYKSKKVIVTGHTGFKGSWLTVWLLKIGANVIGISKDIPTNPSMFKVINLEGKIKHYKEDVRDLDKIRSIINVEKPDFIFHLAAQAIVSTSYTNPIDTISTNAIGTANILEVLKNYKRPCVAVMVTSDKCYDNVEWLWGYKESDNLGGKDIYSGSKAAAELIIKSYYHSFFKDNDHPVKIGVGRAGNVIGGGDWAKDRIIVDCMMAWSDKGIVEIRSPKATRPWQHVLEPLSGYLVLGAKLFVNKKIHGETFNFGPKAEQNRTVVELMTDLSKYWSFNDIKNAYKVTANIPFKEAGLLKLNCDKALFYLKWESNLEYFETIRFVSKWYYSYYNENLDMYKLTLDQIEEYEGLGIERDRIWSIQK